MTSTELDGKAVPLEGNNEDLRYLAEQFHFRDFGVHKVISFRQNPTTNEEEEYDEYYLKSANFDSKKDNWEIYGNAVDIIELINGEAQLETRLFHSVKGKVRGGPELESVQAKRAIAEFQEGRQTSLSVLGATANANLIPSDFIKILESQGLEIPEDIKKLDDESSIAIVVKQERVIETRFPLLDLAKNDPDIREALVYFGYPHSWASLYRVWDVIKKDTKYRGQRFNDKDFKEIIKGTNVGRKAPIFAQTANYHRHGGGGRKLPKDPLNLDDAERFIRVLMLHWVSWKKNSSAMAEKQD